MAARSRKRATTTAHDESTVATAAGAKPKPKPKPKPKRARKSAATECRPSQQRTSAFRGVTRHRWTGRFEAHLWDKDSWNHESRARKKKGKQVYLGAYDDEEAAARAYDLAALKYWGRGTVLNFPLCSYDEELKEMESQSREEYVGSVRRKSSGFSRGVSKYRGVARHHHNGRWEARIGRVLGNKYLYLGTYATQEEAAVAYDIAAIEHRGLNAVTNFDISHYVNWHRRRLGMVGLDANANEMVPTKLPNGDLTGNAVATMGLDETVDMTAPAAVYDGEDHRRQYRIADSYIVEQLPDDDHHQVMRTPVHEAPPPSALDLLLHSSKVKEMIMEQMSSAPETTPTTTTESSTDSRSPCTSSSLSQSSPERQPESSGGALSAPPCTFPDDVQTCFDFECDDGMSFAFAEVDTFLFGDLGSYAAPMFQCDVDVFV